MLAVTAGIQHACSSALLMSRRSVSGNSLASCAAEVGELLIRSITASWLLRRKVVTCDW
jgi:hypothetical protein